MSVDSERHARLIPALTVYLGGTQLRSAEKF